MKLNRWMALILVSCLGVAMFVWSHAHTKAYKSDNAAPIQRVGMKIPG